MKNTNNLKTKWEKWGQKFSKKFQNLVNDTFLIDTINHNNVNDVMLII